MKRHCPAQRKIECLLGVTIALFVALCLTTSAHGEVGIEAGVQILTRGPVHEAFAEASLTRITAGLVITSAPNQPIVEVPPAQQPEGGNVGWIPGYWSWDDERSSYIWVSGVWRDLPPGRQWVPGYWTPVQGGSQWISGFWQDAVHAEITYLPEPPAPREVGPGSPAPSPGNVWTPGCWIWQQSRYAWQPGYWVVQQPDWVWAPAHYTWTPRGYVFVQGYWDHDLQHRGVMFAPVYYEQPVYARPNYSYSPSIVIDIGIVTACLFVQPQSHHYYFGDYYDSRYEQRGFRPWYSRHETMYGEDPNYAHYRVAQLRNDPEWDVHVDEQFRYRREHVEARPPQTLAIQVNIMNTRKSGEAESLMIGQTFAEASQRKSMPQRFTPVNNDRRKKIESRGREFNTFRNERAVIEAKRSQEDPRAPETVNMRAPAASGTERSAGRRTPPSRPQIPGVERGESGDRQAKQPRNEMKTQSQADQSAQPVERTRRAPKAEAQPRERKSPEASKSDRPKRVSKPQAKTQKGGSKERSERAEPGRQKASREKAANTGEQKNRKK